ncbi:MAG: GreA/GreB family elongation factor [Deltaproteobacteria bacterium]|nr:GreA/GreB family elongation factor [Deltaproteobacteria bacterium]
MAEVLPNYITPAGYQRLLGEFEHLKHVEHPKIIQEVSDAAAQGDRSENAEYIYGKKRKIQIEKRMSFLASRLKDVVVVDPAAQKGAVIFFGATVDLEDEDARTVTYQIVGVDETAPDRGLISWRSPLGRALLKRRVGDTVAVPRPDADPVEYTVLAFRYG